jgi:hypothetical protein
MRTTVARSIALAGACIGGGLAIQPAYAEPAVRSLVINGVEVLLISASLSGAALMIGAVAVKLEDWHRSLPPAAPALPMKFATSYEAVTLAHEETQADPEQSWADQWIAAMRRFACIGNVYGFGWSQMSPSMGREDWQACSALMFGAKILIQARGKRATHWAPGWSYSRFSVEIKHGRLALTYPDQPAPQIEWSRNVTLTHAWHA